MTTMISLPELDAASLAVARDEPAGLPLLVEFFADHCVWCDRLEPVLAAARESWGNRVRIVKVNALRHPQALPDGGIRGTPTVALYREGRLVMTRSGMIQRAALDAFLSHWLDPANEGLAST